MIDLTAPYRSEDAAVTPIRIKAMMAQTPERYIAAIHLFVDENPEPLVGRFRLYAGGDTGRPRAAHTHRPLHPCARDRGVEYR